MAELGKYCKAFLWVDLRAWPYWEEATSASSTTAEEHTNQSDDTVVFIHHDYRVTKTVFLDEQVIYAKVTPEWISFCQERLGFEVPSWAE